MLAITGEIEEPIAAGLFIKLIVIGEISGCLAVFY